MDFYSHPARHCDCGADYSIDPGAPAHCRSINEPAAIVGVILIIVGIIGFAWGGLGWTTQKKDAQLGPLEITHKESHGIAFPPIASGICLIGGIALVVMGSRKS